MEPYRTDKKKSRKNEIFIPLLAARLLNKIFNLFIIAVVMIVIAYGAYGIWDSNKITQSAMAKTYAIYKPGQDLIGFEELQSINPDVFAWVDIYGTTVDYPIVKSSKGESYYLNHDVFGNYSLTGTLFVGQSSKKNFADFNTIVYGHNMTPQVMFGNIRDYHDKNYFDTHLYGSLTYKGAEHGLYIFAFCSNVDAYDREFYQVIRESSPNKMKYYDTIMSKVMYKRDVTVGEDDKILIMSTCSSTQTNGRNVLIAKITDELYENIYEGEESVFDSFNMTATLKWGPFMLWQWVLILLAILVILLLFLVWRRHKLYGKKRG